jgi:hypothetical protein
VSWGVVKTHSRIRHVRRRGGVGQEHSCVAVVINVERADPEL